jgi:hypothetical protein
MGRNGAVAIRRKHYEKNKKKSVFLNLMVFLKIQSDLKSVQCTSRKTSGCGGEQCSMGTGNNCGAKPGN